MSKTIIVGMVGGALAVAGTGGGAAYYIQHYSKPSEAEIKDALAGLKCRCGTHVSILKAVKRAAAMLG